MSCIGRNKVPGIKNINLTGKVTGHSNYIDKY